MRGIIFMLNIHRACWDRKFFNIDDEIRAGSGMGEYINYHGTMQHLFVLYGRRKCNFNQFSIETHIMDRCWGWVNVDSTSIHVSCFESHGLMFTHTYTCIYIHLRINYLSEKRSHLVQKPDSNLSTSNTAFQTTFFFCVRRRFLDLFILFIHVIL